MKNNLDAIKVGAMCPSTLDQQGAEIEMSTDFARAEDIAKTLGKDSFTPKLSHDFNDFIEQNAFWLFMKESGEYTASVAARFDNIGRESMSQYLRRTMARHYPHQGGDTLTNVADALPAGFHGGLAYIGELYVGENARGSRRKLRSFMMMQVMIATKWDVDWTYAFMRDRDVQRGFSTLYGFTMQIPGIYTWNKPAPAGRGDTEWLVSLPAPDLEHVMSYYANLVEGL